MAARNVYVPRISTPEWCDDFEEAMQASSNFIDQVWPMPPNHPRAPRIESIINLYSDKPTPSTSHGPPQRLSSSQHVRITENDTLERQCPSDSRPAEFRVGNNRVRRGPTDGRFMTRLDCRVNPKGSPEASQCHPTVSWQSERVIAPPSPRPEAPALDQTTHSDDRARRRQGDCTLAEKIRASKTTQDETCHTSPPESDRSFREWKSPPYSPLRDRRAARALRSDKPPVSEIWNRLQLTPKTDCPSHESQSHGSLTGHDHNEDPSYDWINKAYQSSPVNLELVNPLAQAYSSSDNNMPDNECGMRERHHSSSSTSSSRATDTSSTANLDTPLTTPSTSTRSSSKTRSLRDWMPSRRGRESMSQSLADAFEGIQRRISVTITRSSKDESTRFSESQDRTASAHKRFTPTFWGESSRRSSPGTRPASSGWFRSSSTTGFDARRNTPTDSINLPHHGCLPIPPRSTTSAGIIPVHGLQEGMFTPAPSPIHEHYGPLSRPELPDTNQFEIDSPRIGRRQIRQRKKNADLREELKKKIVVIFPRDRSVR